MGVRPVMSFGEDVQTSEERDAKEAAGKGGVGEEGSAGRHLRRPAW